MFRKREKDARPQAAAPVVPAAAEFTQTAEIETGGGAAVGKSDAVGKSVVDHDAQTARPGETRTPRRDEATQPITRADRSSAPAKKSAPLSRSGDTEPVTTPTEALGKGGTVQLPRDADRKVVRSKGGRTDLETLLTIAAQVLSALAAAHRGGVVHRELTPDNIFLETREGMPVYAKLLDFGIAKIMDDDVLIAADGLGIEVRGALGPEGTWTGPRRGRLSRRRLFVIALVVALVASLGSVYFARRQGPAELARRREMQAGIEAVETSIRDHRYRTATAALQDLESRYGDHLKEHADWLAATHQALEKRAPASEKVASAALTAATAAYEKSDRGASAFRALSSALEKVRAEHPETWSGTRTADRAAARAQEIRARLDRSPELRELIAVAAAGPPAPEALPDAIARLDKVATTSKDEEVQAGARSRAEALRERRELLAGEALTALETGVKTDLAKGGFDGALTRIAGFSAHLRTQAAADQLAGLGRGVVAAARGLEGRLYPWGDTLSKTAKPPQALTTAGKAPVATDSAAYHNRHPKGIPHLAGNVAEWTASDLAAYPGGSLGGFQKKAGQAVVRGGSFASIFPTQAMSTARDPVAAGTRRPDLGSRLVKDR